MSARPRGAPRRALMRVLRPPLSRAVQRRYRVESHGEEQVPTSGPVIFAANHTGWLDGPLLGILSPRPTHVLTKRELFVGKTGLFLSAVGQIPLERSGTDREAIRSCEQALSRGRCVGIFPEGQRGGGTAERCLPGAAYLALRSGAPIVPVAILGTREPGADADSLPTRGARIVLHYGTALRPGDRRTWPVTRTILDRASGLVQEALSDHVADATVRHALPLPGPLPEVP